jgi:MFS family permease
MIFNIVSVFLAVPIGKLSDKVGRERMIIPGFLVFAVTYFLFGYFNSISVFIWLFVLYGLYSALVDGSQKALISDIINKDLRGTGYGLYHSIIGITLLPASLIAGLLYDNVSSKAPFYFSSITALVAAFLMIIFVIIDKSNHNSKKFT